MDIGQTLDGRYLLQERLGVGGTSIVFRAEDVELGRPVAVKVFGPESEVSDSDRRRREARILAGLRHPAIVALYDAKLGGDPPYLVLEYVAGTTLYEAISRGPLSREQTRRIGAAAASGLARAHAEGIVHRDVKPANLVVVDDDPLAAARVLDFGIAHSRDISRHTRTGSVLGSALYLSPEQARGQELTPASDVYSLGLVLIECLTGRPAFPGDGLDAVAARLTDSPTLEHPALSGDAALLARMTAREPADRPTADEVAHALSAPAETLVLPAMAAGAVAADALVPTAAMTSAGAGAPTVAHAPTVAGAATEAPESGSEDAPRRRRSALVGAAAAAALAVAGGILLLQGPGDPVEDVPAKVLLPVGDETVEPPAPEVEEAADTGPENGNSGNGNPGNGNPGNGNPGDGNNGDRGNGNRGNGNDG